MEPVSKESSACVAMAFAGGLGLAAYHAGVYEAFPSAVFRLTG